MSAVRVAMLDEPNDTVQEAIEVVTPLEMPLMFIV